MTKFKVNSQFYSNLCLLSDKEITNCMCSLQINEFKPFEISLLQLISSSSVFAQQILFDITQKSFSIFVPFQSDVNEEFINKIERSMKCEEIELENDNEIINFMIFGKTINNEQIINIISPMLECEINDDNVINMIKIKLSSGFQFSEESQEIIFLSKNFSKLKNNIQELSNCEIYQPIIELIIGNRNLKIEDEDELLTFILTISKTKEEYIYFFKYLWLEYCSISKIKELIQYCEDKIFNTINSKSILYCFTRKLTQDRIHYLYENTTRYTPKYIEYNDCPSNGILHCENAKGNVILEASLQLDSLFNILDSSNSVYLSNNNPNSWIEASLKNNHGFIINKYMFKGRDCSKGNNHLQTWKLEGQLKDGSWIELDSQRNQELWEGQTKTYDIARKEIITSVKITQTDKSTYGKNILAFSQFDIFGVVLQ